MDNTFINQHNLTQSIFNAGNAGVIQNLAGRIPNVDAVLSGKANIASALNTINTIPGLSTALNGLPGNPLGALTQFSGLNLQGGLPSLTSLIGNGSGAAGSLTAAFSLASSLGASNIPASITGAVQLAQQIKTIICNLKIPNITIPNIEGLLKMNFTAVEKQIKQLLLHELQSVEDVVLAEVNKLLNPFAAILKQIASFFDPNNIKKMLASVIPDVNDLIKNTVKQFTTCNDGPAAKKNDLSGKNPTGTAPAPSAPTDSGLQINTPIQNTGTGFGNAGPDTGAPQTFGSGFNSTGAPQTFGSAGPGTIAAPPDIQPTTPTANNGSFGSGFASSGSSGGSFGSAFKS